MQDQQAAQRLQGQVQALLQLPAQQLIEEARRLDGRLRLPDTAVGSQEKSEIARTLVAMHREMDRRLRAAPKNEHFLPQVPGVVWDPNDPLAGIVEGISPFHMIDWWIPLAPKGGPPKPLRPKVQTFEADIITVEKPHTAAPPPPKIINEDEKKRLAKKFIKDHYPPDIAQIIMDGLDLAGYAQSVVEFADTIANVLDKFPRVGGAFSLAGIVFTGVQGFWEWHKAVRYGVTLYEQVAWAYGLTAWAFGDKMPTQSRVFIRNMDEVSRIDEFHEAWSASSRKAVERIREFVKKAGVREEAVKILYRVHFKNSRQNMAKAILMHFNEKMRSQPLSHYRAFLAVVQQSEYPN
jgi:hypothetical protein